MDDQEEHISHLLHHIILVDNILRESTFLKHLKLVICIFIFSHHYSLHWGNFVIFQFHSKCKEPSTFFPLKMTYFRYFVLIKFNVKWKMLEQNHTMMMLILVVFITCSRIVSSSPEKHCLTRIRVMRGKLWLRLSLSFVKSIK